MTPDERKAWVASLKVGDEVAIDSQSIAKIDSMARGCPVVGMYKFSRDGKYRGDAWNFHRIKPVTDEIRAKIAETRKRAHLVGELDRVRWRDLPTAALEAALAATVIPAALVK